MLGGAAVAEVPQSRKPVRKKERSALRHPPRKAPMSRNQYGIVNFAFDAILTMLTGGFWLIWVFVREMRKS